MCSSDLFAIHSGTLGLFVNTEALGRGVPVPEGWNDLLKPVYRGKVGYLNPVSAAVGQVGLFFRPDPPDHIE